MARSKDRTFTTGFIDLYRANDCLWLVTSKDFSNKQKRDEAYKQLLDYSGVHKSDVDLEWVKKIANLQTVCVKEHNRVIDSQHSGTGTDDFYKPGLWYYDQMKFLQERESKLHGQGSLDSEREVGKDTLDLESTPELAGESTTVVEQAELEMPGEESEQTSQTRPPPSWRCRVSTKTPRRSFSHLLNPSHHKTGYFPLVRRHENF